MKRLLCIISCMNSGGAETFLMKVYRYLDKTKYQMDFCVNMDGEGFYEKEIIEMGGKIYHIPSKSYSYTEFKKQLFAIVKENKYEYVLRITSNAMGFLDLKIAKKAGARICAARSSNSSDGGSWRALIAHKIGQLLYGKYVNVKIAPSDLAARYTFGERAYELGQVHILHNGLDLSAYNYSEKARDEIRSEFSIKEDTVVVGHIGRFMEQKNHLFLLDVFDEYHKRNINSVLMLVGGNGDLEEKVRLRAREKGLYDSVIFTGVRSDISRLLSTMDVLVMPSLYEGMPNTVIEAQAVGLPCVISDAITKEANITGYVTYLSLDVGVNEWSDCIVRTQGKRLKDSSEILKSSGYDIHDVAKDFLSIWN